MCGGSIIDENLVGLISKELTRIGLFVPISEIETTIIRIYDSIQKAHEADKNSVTINSYNKDANYYMILKNAVCADIVSKVRLTKAHDSYEACSILAMLQGYLDKLAETAGTVNIAAPIVFEDILQKLPFKVVMITTFMQPKQSAIIASGITPTLYVTKEAMLGTSEDVNKDFIKASQKRLDVNKINVCTNAIDCGSCELCPSCTASQDPLICGDFVSLSIMYKGMCYGVKLDPEALDIIEDTNTHDLNIITDKAALVRKQITRMARKLKQHSKEIFLNFYTIHREPEEPEDE